MIELLQRCIANYERLECCHPESLQCDCSLCLHKQFYLGPDRYNCQKKANYYVMNYGPSYASEFYYYLTNSAVLHENYVAQNIRKIKVLSLGCGFAPDLVALDRYVYDESLPLEIEYHGIDLYNCWEGVRYVTSNSHFHIGDVTQKINLVGYDMVVLSKLFSTLWKNKLGDQFISILRDAVSNQLRDNGIVIFNDVNSCHLGRDVFHKGVVDLFGHVRQYYCDSPPYSGYGWIKIPEEYIAFKIPSSPRYSPLLQITKNVFFEYRK